MKMFPAALMLTIIAAGCSLRLDTDPFREPLPSTPEISIDPSRVLTSDDLTVDRAVDSTDLLNESVGYLYEWSRDGVIQDDLDTKTTTHRRTRRGETWTVRVTPITGATGRRGAPAVSSVTIADTPSRVQSIGFSNYAPHNRERLRAYVLIDDPDLNDDEDRGTVPVTYQWCEGPCDQGGTPLAGGQSIDLAEVEIEAGVKLQLCASVDGVLDSRTCSAEIEIQEDVMRWRELLPDRNEIATAKFWDPLHNRVLFLRSATTDERPLTAPWEFAVDGETPQGRYVQLPLPPPDAPWPVHFELFQGSMVYDTRRERGIFLTIGEGDSCPDDIALWELQLEDRAQPTWRRLPCVPGGPESRGFPSLIYDEDRDRVLVFGGLRGDVALDDAWALELSEAMAWRRLNDIRSESLTPAVLPGAGGGGAVVVVPEGERRRAFILGGWEGLQQGATFIAASRRAIEVDFTHSDIAFPSVSELPEPTGSGIGAYAPDPRDPAFDQVYVGYGRPAFFSQAYGSLWKFDPAALDNGFDEVVVGADFPRFIDFFNARISVYDPRHHRILIDSAEFTGDLNRLQRGFWALRPSNSMGDAERWLPFARYGVDLPPSLAFATTWATSDHLGLLGGARAPEAYIEPSGWTFDFTTGAFSELVDAPTDLAARGGIATTSGTNTGAVVFGGMERWWTRTPEIFANNHVWLLFEDEWRQQTVMGEPLESRVVHATFPLPCAEGSFAYFGGFVEAEEFVPLLRSNDTGILACDSGVCTHTPNVVEGPGDRFRVTVAQARDDKIVMFGGRRLGEEGLPEPVGTDVWLFDNCGEEPTWEPADVEGGKPSARSGHSLTAVGGEGVHDPFILVGGDLDASFVDVWRLDRLDADQYVWTRLDPGIEATLPPRSRGLHNVGFNPSTSSLVMYGGERRPEEDAEQCLGSGENCIPAHSDLWELRIPPEFFE